MSFVAFTIALTLPVFSSSTIVVAGIPLNRVASCGTQTTLIAVFPGFGRSFDGSGMLAVIRAGMKRAVWLDIGRLSLWGIDIDGVASLFVFGVRLRKT